MLVWSLLRFPTYGSGKVGTIVKAGQLYRTTTEFRFGIV